MLKKINLFFMLLTGMANAHAQPPLARLYAEKVAQRMKDSLGLSIQTRVALYNVNMELFNKAAVARSRYAGSDSLGFHLQKIENSRDSLYRPLLDSAAFADYRRRKNILLNNN